MLNLPGAEGKAFSSAGTPSWAMQPPEPCRRAAAWQPAPGTPNFPAPLFSQPGGRGHGRGLAPSCPGCPAAL